MRQFPLTIQASLIAWRDLYDLAFKSPNAIAITKPIGILAHAIPHTTYLDWLARGISWFANLYSNNTLKPFEKLKEEYVLLPTDHYKYIQVSHFLKSLK